MQLYDNVMFLIFKTNNNGKEICYLLNLLLLLTAGNGIKTQAYG